jgi:ankyrin repeat protein
MKKSVYIIAVLALSLIISTAPACTNAEKTAESETAIEASEETKSEISEEEMLEIGGAISTRNLEKFKNAIAGFDINARDENGKTILMIAVLSPCAEILEYLIENGADINVWDYSTNTALLYAVGDGELYSVEILIENGADIDAKDGSGNTPLILAASLGGSEEDIFTVYEYVPKNI